MNTVPTMKTWFDRRYCVICNHPPTSLGNPNIPDSIITELFEESSPSILSTTPPSVSTTNTNTIANTKSNTLAPISEDAITINFNHKPLTLSLPSLPTLPNMPGTGPTYKCKQCFARVHLDCLNNNHNNHNNNTDIICPVCNGNASISIQSNYNNLEESIEEEKNLLRDLLPTECLVCGDVGNLICCDLCFNDNDTANNTLFITGNISKLDGAAQFHLSCVNMYFNSNTPVPDPFICPICSREYGSNRLQSLHFFQRKRRKEREYRMQQKALAAQEYIRKIGFRVDEIKKCVFCRINSDDTANGVFFDAENEFIGPFYDELRRIKYYAHYQCVMWSPQVFMNEENGEFVNVEREIKRSKGLTCSVCGKHGAVLGCYERGCCNTYHYHCAVNDEHCYVDNELFAIYCPSHYFVHFLSESINNNRTVIKHHNINGINKDIFEKCRFDQSIMRKRKIARSCKNNDVTNRYKSTVDVWRQLIMKQQHSHSHSHSPSHTKESSITSSINMTNTTYLTRHRRKQIELYQHKKLEKKKKRYKKSLMSIGGRKRSRNCLNGNLCDGEKQLSPHERKRRRVFNLQPMTLNDHTLNIRIEPDKIDFNDIFMENNDYDMSSMVGGLSNAINVLKETVLLPLLYPELFKSFNLKPAKGVILYGPPGTGKTLLVRSLIKYYYAMSRAVFASCKSQSISISTPSPKSNKNPNLRYNSLADAAEIDNKNEQDEALHKNESLISFFSRRGPDLLSKFHGETERNLRSLFARAQELSPSIIFFDEIDGMAPIRSHKHEQVNNSVVATLLSLMDGLHMNNKAKKQCEGVFVIAATNRIDNLDPALRRPGRFDREIYIGLPSSKERYKILKIHTLKWNIECDVDEFNKYLKYISVNKTIGFSGADLASLCNETFMNCINRLCPQLKDNIGCGGYRQDIADRLNVNNIVISVEDFERTFNNGFKSSNMRNVNDNYRNEFGYEDKERIDNLDENKRNILCQLIDRIDIYINRNNKHGMHDVPEKKNDDLSDEDGGDGDNNYIYSVKQERLICNNYNDRILICGCNNNVNKLFLSYLLHRLDIANIKYISIPMIASLDHNDNKQDIYFNILNKIKLLINTGIGVLILYDLDVWLKFYPQIIENILLSNINDMCRNRNVLVLATCNQEWNSTNCWQNQWPQTIYKYFSSFQHNFLIE